MLVKNKLCSPIDLTFLWCVFLYCALLRSDIGSSTCMATQIQEDLQPHSVKVDAKSSNSLTLSWSPPNFAKETRELIGYSVCYTSGFGSTEQRAVIGVEKRSVMIPKLQPSTNYTVYVVAHYSDNKNASSPLFVVSTLGSESAVQQAECDCNQFGTSSCTPPSDGGNANCICHTGYENNQCSECSDTFYPEGERCKPCNCSKVTSYGTCTPNVREESGRECSCLPEHYGPNCDTCRGGFYWHEDQCVNCECLSLCPKNKGHEQCNHCRLLTLNHSVAALKICDEYYSSYKRKQSSRGDGTVAVVAVVVSLSFIALVAGGVSYYRYKCQKQSKHTLWSMELHEEKVSLNSACDYQRLDAAAINAKQDSAAKRQRPRAPTHANKSEGTHRYHCISI